MCLCGLRLKKHIIFHILYIIVSPLYPTFLKCVVGRPNNLNLLHRTNVSNHEHDGNELGTTPEFQSHVAKKVGAFLDEVFSETVDSEPDQSENRDEDEDEESKQTRHLVSYKVACTHRYSTYVTAEESTITKKKKKMERKPSTERREENIIHVSEKQYNGKGKEEQTTVVENLTKKKKG
uniref:Protein CUSTOS n=1 Tax=Sinocyclocheilus rhinocerous TaxID=307959 RepID=A0A673G3F8_9TELE